MATSDLAAATASCAALSCACSPSTWARSEPISCCVAGAPCTTQSQQPSAAAGAALWVCCCRHAGRVSSVPACLLERTETSGFKSTQGGHLGGVLQLGEAGLPRPELHAEVLDGDVVGVDDALPGAQALQDTHTHQSGAKAPVEDQQQDIPNIAVMPQGATAPRFITSIYELPMRLQMSMIWCANVKCFTFWVRSNLPVRSCSCLRTVSSSAAAASHSACFAAASPRACTSCSSAACTANRKQSCYHVADPQIKRKPRPLLFFVSAELWNNAQGMAK